MERLWTNRVAKAAAVFAAVLITALALENVTGSIARYVFYYLYPGRWEWINPVLQVCFAITVVCGLVVWFSFRTKKNTLGSSDILSDDLVLLALLLVLTLVVIGVTHTDKAMLLIQLILTDPTYISPSVVAFPVYCILTICLFSQYRQVAIWAFLPIVLVFCTVTSENFLMDVMVWFAPSLALLSIVSIGLSFALNGRPFATATAFALGGATVFIVLFILLFESGLFTFTELAAIPVVIAVQIAILSHLSDETGSVVYNLMCGVRDIASLVLAVLLTNALIIFLKLERLDEALVQSLSSGSLPGSELGGVLLPAVLATASAILSFALTPFMVLVFVAVIYAPMVSVGLSGESILLAIMMGAIAGSLFKQADQLKPATPKNALWSLYSMVLVAWLIGSASPIFSSVGKTLLATLEGFRGT